MPELVIALDAILASQPERQKHSWIRILMTANSIPLWAAGNNANWTRQTNMERMISPYHAQPGKILCPLWILRVFLVLRCNLNSAAEQATRLNLIPPYSYSHAFRP